MRRALHQLAAFSESSRAILTNPSEPHRGETLLAYLRLQMEPRGSATQDGGTPSVRLFGNRIEYLNYEALRYVFEEIFCHHDYQFVSESPAPVILDCGANIGLAVLYFKRLYPDCRIIAFEPDPRTFGVLQGNVARNGWKDVVLHRAALAASRGQIAFYLDPSRPGSTMMSTVPERMSRASITVETVALSEFLPGEVDFLKMDIEGAEAEVLGELADSGRLRNIRQMVVEYHHHVGSKTDLFSQTLQLLEQNGFGYQIASPLRRPFPRETFQDILIYAYRK